MAQLLCPSVGMASQKVDWHLARNVRREHTDQRVGEPRRDILVSFDIWCSVEPLLGAPQILSEGGMSVLCSELATCAGTLINPPSLPQ